MPPPTRSDLETVLSGNGRVMQVYNQSSDPDGSPSLGLGGLCMGLSYSFIRGQIKASHDTVRQGNYFSFHKATAHARFAQASSMNERKLTQVDMDSICPMKYLC